MAYIKQTINTLLSQSSGLTWRQGSVLATPQLLGPRNESNICSPQAAIENFILGGTSGITLRWTPVTGASYYVIQWSNNSSFNGPTVNGAKVTHPVSSYPMNLYTGIDLSRKVFWRVMAFSSTGDVSSKSETWSFTFECQDLGANAENKNINCENYNVEIKLRGPDYVKGDGQQALYHLNVDWDCLGESSEGDYSGEISLVNVVWSVEQSSRNPVTIACQNSNFAVLDIQSSTSEMFTVKATATFEVAGSGIQFSCSEEKDVTIDATTVGLTDIRHGRIVCVYGDNTYLVGLVDRLFYPEDYLGDPLPSSGGSDCLVDDFYAYTRPSGADEESSCDTYRPIWQVTPQYLESNDPIDYVFASSIVRNRYTSGRDQHLVGTDVIVCKIRQPSKDLGSSSSSSGTCDNRYEDSWWIIQADDVQYPIVKVTSPVSVPQGQVSDFEVYTNALDGPHPTLGCTGILQVTPMIGSYVENTIGYAAFVEDRWVLIAAECGEESSSSA